MANEEHLCPVKVILNIIDDKWKVLILWHLMRRTRRYSDLKKLISLIPPKMLT
ncbi:winged helix-turn-helix transcriptional regulator [Aneurinibacillus sp. Ricciae_BoGa-3]|uniref:winged helix-turn-helix transcriptional regulator n=1 Tax=Aneurinibacillus sp. Ricciae_BoGa-3 TaxID=3022697 RepID=UPI003FA47F0B